MTLIEALKVRQGETSQVEFARRLEISAAMLSRIYSGERLVGEAIVRRIVRAYPELTWLATGYLMTKEEGDVA